MDEPIRLAVRQPRPSFSLQRIGGSGVVEAFMNNEDEERKMGEDRSQDGSRATVFCTVHCSMACRTDPPHPRYSMYSIWLN